jgi:hypothetical protein
MNTYFDVIKSSFDASRPYTVLANFRSFNRAMGSYSTEAKAKRRARDLMRAHGKEITERLVLRGVKV